MGTRIKEQNRLYLRLPVKIVDEHQILELHPKISVVRLPRQKTRRWCTVEFKEKSDLQEALKELKKLKINGKSIKVKSFQTPSKQENNKIRK